MTSEISNVYSSTDYLILSEITTKGGNFSATGHCFISKNHILEADIIESILANDHFTILYQQSLKLECKKQNTEYLMRDKRTYTSSKFNLEIAVQDRSLIYKK